MLIFIVMGNEGVFLNDVLRDKNNTKFCMRCGMENDSDAVFCVLCGERIDKNGKNNYMLPCSGRVRRRRTALVLGVVLGVFGAHKFYEKKFRLGFLYMLTGGLFIIGVVADFINLLSKPEVYYV